jgi:hypothetical protein
MNASERWFAEAARIERARVRDDVRRIFGDAKQVGEDLVREHPFGSLVATTALVALGVAGITSAKSRSPRASGRGVLRASLTGALRAGLAHFASDAWTQKRRGRARDKTPSAEESSRT